MGPGSVGKVNRDENHSFSERPQFNFLDVGAMRELRFITRILLSNAESCYAIKRLVYI
jgi:hypothetical protein